MWRPGYDAEILIRWGDPVLAGAPAFDPMARPRQRRTAVRLQQRLRRLLPARRLREHGLLVVNHEYTNEELMFPGAAAKITKEDKFGYLTRSWPRSRWRRMAAR